MGHNIMPKLRSLVTLTPTTLSNSDALYEKAMSHHHRLNAEDVQQAIFIDYEGNIDKPPTLLGWRLMGETHASIIEAAFTVCANRYGAKSVEFQDHATLALHLIELAEQEGRKLVSWSEHDFRVMAAVLSESDQVRLRTVYVNAIRTSRPWHYLTQGKAAKDASLAYFSQLLGFAIPTRYGLGLVGQGLRLIRLQINEGRTYAALTKSARASWVSIVKHNRFDLAAIEFVLRLITTPRKLQDTLLALPQEI